MTDSMPLPPLLLAFTLVAAGCPGDDGGHDDAADPTAATAATGATGTDPDDASATTPGADDSTGTATDPTTDGGPGPTTDATDDGATTMGDATAGSDGTGQMQMPPPTDGAALLTWLQAGEYLGWTSESAVHDSQGPHFGDVRTYVNDALADSLTAGSPTHPVDAAAVKELYGTSATPQGWSVIVKVAEGEGGDTWYLYEYFDGTTYGDAVGDGGCTGCHSMGSLDYFKSPFPLQ